MIKQFPNIIDKLSKHYEFTMLTGDTIMEMKNLPTKFVKNSDDENAFFSSTLISNGEGKSYSHILIYFLCMI